MMKKDSKMTYDSVLCGVNFDTNMLDLKEVLNKQIVDIYLHEDSDGEELQIVLEDGKQIEICLLDNGKIHVQSD